MKRYLSVVILVLSWQQSAFSQGQGVSCSVPQNIQFNQNIIFPIDCTLEKLNLAKKKFDLIEKIDDKTDRMEIKRFIGVAGDGLILEVNPEGRVYSLLKTKPWKTTKTTLSFEQLIKNEFLSKKSKIHKAKK